jgi:hypothetical protein
LFVEDASFTVAIVVCLLLAAFVIPVTPLAATWRGPALFAMLAVVLLENVYRSARP